MPLQIRRGTNAQRLTYTPLEGELVYDADLRKLFIGARDTLSEELIEGGLPVTGVDELEITEFLEDFNGTIGSGPSLLVDGGNGQIVLDGTVKGNIVPDESELYDIGSPEIRFKELWLSGPNLNIGSAVLSANETVLNLPEGSTVGGFPIASENYLDNEINGSTYYLNIVGDDSSLIVDSFNNVIGNFETTFRGSSLVNRTSPNLDIETTLMTLSAVTSVSTIPAVIINSSTISAESPQNTSPGDFLGQMVVRGYYDESYKFASGILTKWSSDADLNTNFPNSEILFLTGNNSNTQDTVTASLDAQGKFTAKTIQPGVYVDEVARDTALAVPQPGMMIFNETTQKFQGYVSDVGLATGEGSNSTPGWIDLH
jgi:hypothetical protein